VNTEISLDRVYEGQLAQVMRISGGWQIRQKFSQIGIHIGDHLLVKRRALIGGPVLIRVNDYEVAIGRTLAHHIWVVNKSA
jgi:ferrous iron transport protein A